LEILAYELTPLGLLILRRRELLSRPGTMVTEVTLDHEFLMSSYLTESERQLTQLGLARLQERDRSDPVASKKRMLVGGLGLGYTAAEGLKHPDVAEVEVVEFLPQVIGWTRAGLIPLSETLNNDPRLAITQGDIYARLTGPAERLFDLIVIDVDHSPEDVLGEQSHGFYSVPGLQAAREHLTAGGVIGVWSYDESTPLLDSMRQVFADVSVEQVTVWNDLINESQTDWLFFGRRN
jgi:spermidine synthase